MRARRIAAAAGFAAAVLLVVGAGAGARPVSADGGPHFAGDAGGGSYGGDCETCHRYQGGYGDADLIAPEVELCLSCHGPGAFGATTDVINGVEAGSGRGLRGGGFSFALMDTGWNGAAMSRPSTSAHMTDAAVGVTAWGSGGIGSGAGTSFSLTCTTCHDPHGNGNYRILRPIPRGSTPDEWVWVPDQPVPVYTVQSAENRYFGEVYGNGNYDWQGMYLLDQWCATCHTRLDAPEAGQATTDSGDPIFRYRHTTRWPTSEIDCLVCHGGPSGGVAAPNPFDITYRTAHEPVCQTCHVAHGSSASMGPFSGHVAWPDGSTEPSGSARSSLLRLDNRGVCAGCHDPTDG